MPILETQTLLLIPDLIFFLSFHELELAESVKRKCPTCVSKVALCRVERKALEVKFFCNQISRKSSSNATTSPPPLIIKHN